MKRYTLKNDLRQRKRAISKFEIALLESTIIESSMTAFN